MHCILPEREHLILRVSPCGSRPFLHLQAANSPLSLPGTGPTTQPACCVLNKPSDLSPPGLCISYFLQLNRSPPGELLPNLQNPTQKAPSGKRLGVLDLAWSLEPEAWVPPKLFLVTSQITSALRTALLSLFLCLSHYTGNPSTSGPTLCSSPSPCLPAQCQKQSPPHDDNKSMTSFGGTARFCVG